MHEVFGTDKGSHHNCLGCNFADATNGIDYALTKIIAHRGSDDLDYSDYVLWLYLFVERANIILDICQVPEGIRHRHFGVFVTIKRWANFLKHPNWFILVHHPTYCIDGYHDLDRSKYSAVIDTDFVEEHYNAEARSRSSSVRKKLQNVPNVLVEMPNPETLTEQFCEAAIKLFELPKKNEAYKELLADISTYENYYSLERSGDAKESKI